MRGRDREPHADVVNRRQFLGALCAVPLAAVGAPLLPSQEDLIQRYIVPAAAGMARDIETGIAIRFIRHFDIEAAKCVSRFDLLVDPSLLEMAARHA